LIVITGNRTIANKIEVLDAHQFGDFVNEAKLNASQTPIYVNPKNLDNNRLAGCSAKNSANGKLPVNISGGDDKTKYSITGSYFTQDGNY
jgi:hypothetical protein